MQRYAGCDIEHLDRLVMRTRCDELPVRGERDGTDLSGVSSQRWAFQVSGLGISDTNRSILQTASDMQPIP